MYRINYNPWYIILTKNKWELSHIPNLTVMIMYCFHNNSPVHFTIIKDLQMIDLKFAFRSMIDRSGLDRSNQSFSRIVWPLVFAIRNWQIYWCASCPASGCRSGGRHLGKFAWGSNLASVFEAVQSRPSTTFPESWHDYWKQYFRSFGRGICLPDSPKWRYRQNYDVNKWQVWIWEAFLGRISASPGATDGWHCWQNIPNL